MSQVGSVRAESIPGPDDAHGPPVDPALLQQIGQIPGLPADHAQMAKAVLSSIPDADARSTLVSLLSSGKLDATGSDGVSILNHLYDMATGPRNPGMPKLNPPLTAPT